MFNQYIHWLQVKFGKLIIQNEYIEIVITEKDLASKKYFERLINKPNMPNLTESQEIKANSSFSPIEKIFHKHMKRSLMNYEDYYQEIYTKFQSQCKVISAQYTEKLATNSSKLERKTRRIARKIFFLFFFVKYIIYTFNI